jgi:excinuclease ABC subunit C
MNLKDKIRQLPCTPGVYLMKDSGGGVIYVGKAKNLKNRVQSYFRSSSNHTPKVKKLTQHLKDFDILHTDTEFEAFLLECQLIKEIKPMYNRMMKNPKSFMYIRIRKDKDFPAMDTAYHMDEINKYDYFGPYTSVKTVEKAMEGIKDFFKINCNQPFKKNGPCLNFSLGLCLGMCTGNPSAIETYKQIVNKMDKLLQGTDMSLINEINHKMQLAADNFEFESAAKYRDYLDSLSFLLKKEKVIEFTEKDNNMVVLEHLSLNEYKLFLINRTQVLYKEKISFNYKEFVKNHIQDCIMKSFKATSSATVQKVDRNQLDEAQIIYSYLQSGKCRYFIIPFEDHNHVDTLVLDGAIETLLNDIFIKNFQHT